MGRERIEELACKLCEANNGSGCTQIYSPDPGNWICKAWLSKAEAGYTCQPEPPQDKVEAVAKILCYSESNADVEEDLEYYRGVARGILKLFPEYEPVALEALGDEELCAGCGVSDLRETTWASWCKQGKCTGYNERKEASQATILKNQAEGQLFRLKEV